MRENGCGILCFSDDEEEEKQDEGKNERKSPLEKLFLNTRGKTAVL